MDDQFARCEVAEIEGWGKVLKKRTQQTIEAACNDLIIRSKHRHDVKQSVNGADQLSDLLLGELYE